VIIKEHTRFFEKYQRGGSEKCWSSLQHHFSFCSISELIGL
jgi:hypothetical protein